MTARTEEVVELIDFRNSFVINTAAIEGRDVNTCRTKVVASCALWQEPLGRRETYYLGQACIGEHMYLDGQITQEPTSEVAVIFNREAYKLVKRFADHADDVTQVARPADPARLFDGRTATWTDLRFALQRRPARRLPDPEAIIAATIGLEPLAARTILQGGGGFHAVLEYPVEYMNVHPPMRRFQVDAGPILWPDLASRTEPWVDRLQIAYILYTRLDAAEFVVRAPVTIGTDRTVQTQHYARVEHVAAGSELFSLEA